MRTCPFAGCEVTLPDHLFSCKTHWWHLSRPERAQIHAAYDDYLNDRIDMEQLRKIQQEVLGDRGTA